MRTKISVIICALGFTYAHAQVQNISSWTLDTFDSANISVGGITYQNNYATPLTVTTSIGTYNAGTAGAGADDVFVRRNTATPTSTTNTNGQAVSSLSASSGSSTVYGTYHATMQDLLLGGNVLNSTWDTFANSSSGAGNIGHNIERVDFVWSDGYTTVGDEVIIVFNFDPIGAQDDFRVAVFTGIDGSANKLPTAYANTGVLVTGSNYPDKLPLPLSGSPTSSTSTGFRTSTADDLSGTALNRGDSQTVGIGGVAISLATLGIAPGQTIYGYSLIPTDANATSAANLLDFTNNSLYPTNTANADATGTADFSTFGGRIATYVSTTQLGPSEWDGGAGGANQWGSLNGSEVNNNWYSTHSGENNRTPLRDSDVIFGAIPSTNQTVDLNNAVEARKMTFDADVNYTIGTSGETLAITLGDPNKAGAPSIEIENTFRDGLQHKINANLDLVENLAINNNTNGTTLCINGTVETNSTLSPDGNTITVNGTGAVNFNGPISGSGDLVKLGSGVTTINNNNSNDPTGTPTQWIGNVQISEGQLVVTADGALGGSVNRTNNLARVAGNTTLQIANASAADLKVGQLVTGTNIPPDTYITNVSIGGTNTTITLSNGFTGAVTNTASITFAGATTVTGPGTLALRSTQTGSAGSYTNTPLNYTTAETITIGGSGSTRLPAENTGAIYNDGGDNIIGSNVTLRLTGGGAVVNSRDDNLTINGVIREASAGQFLGKIGEGVVTLTNSANSYTGATIIANGALRIATNETALPGGFATGGASGGNLTLDGGVLEIGLATAFTRALGTGSDQVQFTGDGGFSAFDTTAGLTRTVTLGSSVAWGSGSFVPTGNALLLSSNFSNGLVNFTNAINLGAALREVRVANGSNAVDAQLSGVLSGGTGGGLNKTGAGTLELTADNTYTGDTQISGGALRIDNANRINGSDLVLNGGVLEINGDLDTGNTGEFTRAVGTTGADDVRWTGGGGFSAAGADRTVRLNNGTASVTWGGSTPTSGFVGANNALILGSVSSGNTVTVANGLFLDGSGNRAIRTVAGTAAGIANGTLSGVVSGAATLAVTGNGRLDLTANNTHTGAVIVTGSELRLSGAAGDLAQSSGFTLRQGGTLTLDNTTAALDRVGAVGTTLAGGTLGLLGQTGNVDTAETIGTVTLSGSAVTGGTSGSANTINIARGDANGSATLTAASLTRNTGTTVNFTNPAGTLGTTGDNPRLVFTTGPAQTDGILAYATINGTDFATHGANGIVAATYSAAAETAWINTTNFSGTPATLTGSRTLNSLRLYNGADVNLGGNTLTVDSGGILVGRNDASQGTQISNGTLTTGSAADLIVHAYHPGAIGTEITATITGSGGLVKSGSAALTLGGTSANTYTGVTRVNEGTLLLNKTAGVNAIAGDANTATTDLFIGDGRGIDTVRLGANEQIANNATVVLNGGEVGNSANAARLELNGATTITDSSRVETFYSLQVNGNSVLDFGGGTVCSPTFLYLDLLTVASDSVLTITNWIEFTDFLLVDRDTFDQNQLPRIVFDGYPGTAQWQSYDSGYYQITPVPEPATYGLLALGSLTAFAAYRRRRRS